MVDILVMVNPYQGRVPYLYLRAHKIVLKKPNPTMNRTAVSIVEVTNIKERDLIQFNTEVNFLKRNWAVTQLKTNVKFHLSLP